MGGCPDGEFALSRQPLGEQAKHHTLAGTRIAADSTLAEILGRGQVSMAQQLTDLG
jgi:hypothetical protein